VTANLPTVREDRQPTPMEILAGAVTEGKLDAGALQVIAELAWKDQDRQARREFNRRLAVVRRGLPEIKKTKAGPILAKSGSGAPAYFYAPLEEVEPAVRGPLLDEGFSYSWDTQVDGTILTATCVLVHENGHEMRSSFSCPTDSPAPQMSGQQKYGGARSYAMRKSLEQVLGLVEIGVDNDGAGLPDQVDFITQEQAVELETWATSLNVDVKGFLAWIRADSFETIPASRYERAKAALAKKQGQQS